MLTKLYEKIVQILKHNYKFFITLIIVFLLCTIRLPYYINCPGGIIDISKRITVEGGKTSTGSLNLAYVTELRATIPTLILAKINPNWDILKKEQVVSTNETAAEVNFRDHLLLEEANDNAIILGFTKALKKVEITSREAYVTFVDPISKTDLKIGDKISKVGEIDISSKQQLYEVLATYKKDDKITLQVERDGKKVEAQATMLEVENRAIIGIMISEKKKYQLPQEVSLHFPSSESGPSGGFMTALSIYNSLSPIDITKGRTIVGTGTIDLDGNVGSIGGVKYKLKGAVKAKADLFLVPAGENYEEALKVKEENNYKIELVPIATFEEALAYLNSL